MVEMDARLLIKLKQIQIIIIHNCNMKLRKKSIAQNMQSS